MKTNRIRFWIFYLTNNDGIDECDANDIYAYTNCIEYAEKFIATRNMNRFFVKSIKLDNDELNDLYKNYMNNILEELDSTTKLNGEYGIIPFKLIVTRYEKIYFQNIYDMYVSDKIYRFVWTDPNIMTCKYKKSLSMLLYSGLHEYIYGDNSNWSESVAKLFPDALSILISKYKPLFSDSTGCDST